MSSSTRMTDKKEGEMGLEDPMDASFASDEVDRIIMETLDAVLLVLIK